MCHFTNVAHPMNFHAQPSPHAQLTKYQP
jgi:hypothetical protein